MSTVYIVSAPSGSGKSTLVSELFKVVRNLDFSISYTTRPPRGSDPSPQPAPTCPGFSRAAAIPTRMKCLFTRSVARMPLMLRFSAADQNGTCVMCTPSGKGRVHEPRTDVRNPGPVTFWVPSYRRTTP